MTGKPKNIRGLAIAAVVAAGVAPLHSFQANNPDLIRDPQTQGYLERARLMTADGNYVGAIDQLRRITSDRSASAAGLDEECNWLLAKAYYECGSADCIEVLRRFVTDYPASPRALSARMLIADYYFFAHDFGAACEAYADVDLQALSPAERETYTYRIALSELKTGQLESAARRFHSLKNGSEYSRASRFYLAYIDYAEGRRDAARKGFEELKQEISSSALSTYRRRRTATATSAKDIPGFPSTADVDCYLAQIEFADGNYVKAFDLATAALRSDLDPDFTPELTRVAGESCFKLGETDRARTYLQSYIDLPGVEAAPSAIYSLGSILYADGQTERAADLFDRIADERSELGQGATLYLGQCAMADGDYTAAAISFEKAYRTGFDTKVSETALYNYVAAREKGGKIPFASSIDLLEDFLKAYPSSKYADSVEEALATAYYNEKNYPRALESINRIPKPSASVLAAKQKVVYELGIAALSTDNPAEAETYMRQAVELSRYDKALALQARLWLADAQYALGKYNDAASNYDEFVKSAPKSENRSLALYGAAYSLYMQEKYKDALKRFSEAENASPELKAPLRADAMARNADCLYYTGNLAGALRKYDEAEKAGSSDPDYIALRKAVVTGLNSDNAGKISQLNTMISAWPDSRLIPMARLELARAYTAIGQIDNAADAYRTLARTAPQSPEARKGMLRLGLLYSEAGSTEKAAEAFRSVISEWPTSEEAQSANEDLRRIYAAKGELAEYAAFLESVPGAPSIDPDSMEKLVFEDADDLLALNPADNARMLKYIAAYPDGKYLAAALSSLSIAAEAEGETDKAIEYATQLCNERPDSRYTPAALLLKAQLVEENYPERSAEALADYRLLEQSGGTAMASEAYAGIMRLTSDPRERLRYAEKVEKAGGLTPERADEATFFRALALADTGDDENAAAAFRKLTSNYSGIYGARAAVELAEIYIRANQLDKAEKLLLDFTDKGTPHQYWLARGFIDLADVYKAKGKTWLALEYIKSLNDNYPGSEQDIKQMINKRLNSWK